MERNIPDVRDIFGRSAKSKHQELRSYDYSPRSRRRHDAMDSFESRLQSYHVPEPRTTSSKKTTSRNRNAEDFPESRSSRKSSEENHRNSSSKSKDSSHYSNRTLTERDIRHLERHLSMKKTIRKQISRNLAQAFVDDPDLVFKESSNSPTQKGSKANVERSFTLTRAKVSKSEQNVLDLLKDNEPDSGHCSADNPNSSDDDTSDVKSQQRHSVKHDGKKHVSRQQLMAESIARKPEQQQHQQQPPSQPSCKEDGKFSFWKMFTVKNKGKR